nr:MAG TPA: hypothetical protein [Caudoviricetes sp.]
MLVNYGVAVPESQFTTTPDKRGVIGQIAFTDTDYASKLRRSSARITVYHDSR